MKDKRERKFVFFFGGVVLWIVVFGLTEEVGARDKRWCLPIVGSFWSFIGEIITTFLLKRIRFLDFKH
jgi:hypothetical protein